MSIHSSFSITKAHPAWGRYPVVLRFASLQVAKLVRYEMHAKRRGGDLKHVDASRTHLNRLLVGSPTWREELEEEVEIARAENLVEEVEALTRAKRVSAARQRLREGKADPWRASKGGPLREVVIAVNREWFETPRETTMLFDRREQEAREDRFEALTVEWLRSRFGDALVHARSDRDEAALHIHAVIAPWIEKTSKRRGRQRLLQPSSHPLLKDYELAQTDVGFFFEQIGLTRGKRDARERRRAEAAGKEIPKKRLHVPPHRWREDEVVRLRKENRELEAKQARLETAIAKLAADREDLQKEAQNIGKRQARVKEAEVGITARTEAVDRRETRLSRSEEALARREAKVERRASEIVKREETVVMRECEADEVLAIADGLADGTIGFDEAGRVQPQPSDNPRRSRLARVLATPGPRARQMLGQVGRAVAAMNRRATAAAEARLSDRFEAIQKTAAAVQSFKTALLRALPETVRNKVAAATVAENRDLERAVRAATRAVRKPDERSEP